MMTPPFADRAAAGRALGAELLKRGLRDPVVYALPRGGVPVAIEVAKALDAPLDLLLVRKIGAPGYEELAAGSIVDGERPDIILNEDVVRGLAVSETHITEIARRELREIERRRALYAPGKAPLAAKDRTAILVDDGVATGASMKAAIAAIRRRAPRRIVAAAPVAAPETAAELAALADEVVCLATPARFRAVGLYYDDFHQLSDAEVVEQLAAADVASRTKHVTAGD